MPVHFDFRLRATVQAAAYLLKLEPDRRMGRLRLLKLLYIADREKLAECAATITGDKVVAMRLGPVLSNTYELIRTRGSSVPAWSQHISPRHLDLVLADDPGTSELCRYDRAKLKEVWERYYDVEDEDLSEITHEFTEWRKNFPEGSTSSHPIPWEDVFQALGRPELAETANEDEKIRLMNEQAFGRR